MALISRLVSPLLLLGMTILFTAAVLVNLVDI
jgi:hypothetical protein